MKPAYATRIVTAPEPGGPDALRVEEITLDPPGPGEILIRIAAAGVNRPDVIERMGFYPPPSGAPKGLGLEVSGTVLALGEGVSGFDTGQSVCALVAGGGYADIARAPAGSVLPVPEDMDIIAAAGLPETVFTVWTNVFEAGALKPGERLLVHGGSSGIGTTAIQMAKAHGAIVMATAGSTDKCDICRRLGADHVFNYREDAWVEGVKAAGGADVILDMVGGDYVAKNLAVLNRFGRLVQIAFLKGSRVEVDLMGLMLKRQTVTGSTLRARSAGEKAALAQAVRVHVWPWIEAGKVKPLIDSTYALADVAKAHERMDSMAHSGKILLIP
ncbi:NAD(P)H quinone oxidoreductase [Glycocaulis albus]|uniref:NAD(P)H quinone oxidoreductase n=1 Tax=Glycocaulis albus TaxID=1382801 RepID=A0ABQ1XE85_9PROT|nr:NAD(P)H-quinone oxidoreductase [Glycocaulis albus]GGG90981.1 NAD(P)H quinone oxidoreductase [Glycocaulis albus]